VFWGEDDDDKQIVAVGRRGGSEPERRRGMKAGSFQALGNLVAPRKHHSSHYLAKKTTRSI